MEPWPMKLNESILLAVGQASVHRSFVIIDVPMIYRPPKISEDSPSGQCAQVLVYSSLLLYTSHISAAHVTKSRRHTESMGGAAPRNSKKQAKSRRSVPFALLHFFNWALKRY
jgi:hypothetical protein